MLDEKLEVLREVGEVLAKRYDGYFHNFLATCSPRLFDGGRGLVDRLIVEFPRFDDHLELLRCHYNFLRPHRALKFGSETRTPAMQAGLTSWRLTFRNIFSSPSVFFVSENLAIAFDDSAIAVDVSPRACDWRRSNS